MPARHWSESSLFFHVLNRAVRRARLFDTDADYRAFLAAIVEGQQRTQIDLLAYCVMPNHFHLVVGPIRGGDLSAFMRWFTATHSKRWHGHRGTTGTGSVYQGRFKAFPVQDDAHFMTVCRYVERNPLRAGLVRRAADWPWSSLYQRINNSNAVALTPWPILPSQNWTEIVEGVERGDEVAQIRESLRSGMPFGNSDWLKRKTTSGVDPGN